MIERKRRSGLSNSGTEVKRFNKNFLFVSRKKPIQKRSTKQKKRHFCGIKLKLATKTSMAVHFTEIVSKCDTTIIL